MRLFALLLGAAAGLAAPSLAQESAPADGPLVAYVENTGPMNLTDTPVSSGRISVSGGVAQISMGQKLPPEDAIDDPSPGIARDLAATYAAAHHGRVATAPILVGQQLFRISPAKLVEQAGGASYIVDVDPPNMNVIYFPTDWSHFDMIFDTSARLIDASSRRVVAQARCFLPSVKTADAPTHEQLLADHAAGLKRLVAHKVDMCLVKLKAGLKLG